MEQWEKERQAREYGACEFGRNDTRECWGARGGRGDPITPSSEPTSRRRRPPGPTTGRGGPPAAPGPRVASGTDSGGAELEHKGEAEVAPMTPGLHPPSQGDSPKMKTILAFTLSQKPPPCKGASGNQSGLVTQTDYSRRDSGKTSEGSLWTRELGLCAEGPGRRTPHLPLVPK